MKSKNKLKKIFKNLKKPQGELRSLVWIAIVICCSATWMLITLMMMLYL